MAELPLAHSMLTNVWDKRFIVGHNRKATRGVVTPENAHPFSYKHIHLVHNGTVRVGNLKGTSTVDSNRITVTMAELGEAKTLALLDGAYVLVWYNSKDQTLNLARNNERELSLGYAKDNNTIYFASEGSMLHWLMHRNKVDIKDIQLLPELHHYKIPLEFVTKMKIKKFEEYIAPITPRHDYSTDTRYSSGITSKKQGRDMRIPDTQSPLLAKGEHFSAKCEGESVISVDNVDHPCYLFRQRATTEPDWYILKKSKRQSYVTGRWYKLKAIDVQGSIYSNVLLEAMMLRKIGTRASAMLNTQELKDKTSCIYKVGENVTFEVDELLYNSHRIVESNSIDVLGETIDSEHYPVVVYWQSELKYVNYEGCLYEGIIKKINKGSDGSFQLELDEQSVVVTMENNEWTGQTPKKEVDKRIIRLNDGDSTGEETSQADIHKCSICGYGIYDSWGYVLTSSSSKAHRACYEHIKKYDHAAERRKK